MRVLRPALAALALLLLPEVAAADLPVTDCPIAFLPCASGGVEGGIDYFWGTFFPMLKIGFIGLALLSFFYYGVQLMLARQEESAITEAKHAYEMAIFGCAIVMLIGFVVDSFAPDNSGAIVHPGPITFGISQVILYIKLILATVVLARLTIQAVRLILLEGQAEGEMEKQKKQFFNGLLGIAAILLANALVAAAFPSTGSAILATELVGIANFLLTLAGFLAVVAIIASGAMLVVSVDESLKDRAKKSASGAVISLVVIVCAFVLVNFFLAL